MNPIHTQELVLSPENSTNKITEFLEKALQAPNTSGLGNALSALVTQQSRKKQE